MEHRELGALFSHLWGGGQDQEGGVPPGRVSRSNIFNMIVDSNDLHHQRYLYSQNPGVQTLSDLQRRAVATLSLVQGCCCC